MERDVARRRPYGAWVEARGSETPSFYLAQGFTVEQLMLMGENPPALGEAVQLRIVVENERCSFDAEGHVIGHYAAERRGRRSRFAVRFDGLDPEQRAYLERLLHE